ncbi:MAG: MBL fold metallo-hydrolase [Alphaproteobacteria bacterium]
MKISFLGAAGTVTGSKYLLEINDKKVLIDCGLFQGPREWRERNWEKLSIDPSKIDAVILTHAHLDHTGYLPVLVKNGFKGPIYSTPGTKELCAILLPDSGHIQEEDAFYANKHHFSRHTPALPLYTKEEAERIMGQFSTIPFDKSFKLDQDCSFVFSRAGHILGAACIRLTHGTKTIVFTGDMGRTHDPIMRDPDPIEETDYLVMESTYGDRLHSTENPEDQLETFINETAARGGTVLIPAFAVGRAQSVLYYISQLKEKKKIPDLPIFLDSPMAENVTDIYVRHIEEHHLRPEHCAKLNAVATYINSVDESKKIMNSKFPCVIIAASGMATGGRVLHHLKTLGPDQRNTILFTGYQAEGTLGRLIVDGEKIVKIHGQMTSIKAKVLIMSNLSAHADYAEMLKWLSHFKKAPKKVFITHGESDSAESMKAKVEAKFHWKCVIPTYLQSEELV